MHEQRVGGGEVPRHVGRRLARHELEALAGPDLGGSCCSRAPSTPSPTITTSMRLPGGRPAARADHRVEPLQETHVAGKHHHESVLPALRRAARASRCLRRHLPEGAIVIPMRGDLILVSGTPLLMRLALAPSVTTRMCAARR